MYITLFKYTFHVFISKRAKSKGWLTVRPLQNHGNLDVEIIEIQTGTYLEEDDIVRFEDMYGRV